MTVSSTIRLLAVGNILPRYYRNPIDRPDPPPTPGRLWGQSPTIAPTFEAVGYVMEVSKRSAQWSEQNDTMAPS
jgi:hypothetical protein